nr:metal ABC transporter permease [Treponema sp.]
MLEIIDKLREYFQYSFVIYALIAGVMIALSSSLLGVNLVLKRFSFIGDGLSHTAFGALAIATVLKITNTMYFVLPVTVVFAIILLCTKENSKIKGDTAVGMISVGALALGYLMLNKFSPKMNISGDVCTTLFGSTSILTLRPGEVILSVVLSVAVVLIYIIFHNKIFAITFDENFAKAGGTNTTFFNVLMAIVVAVVVVLSMNLVGTLLITALIIFPAVSALMLFKTFKSVMLTSSIFSVICAAIGILVAIIWGTPVGATIVLADMILFFIVTLISKIRKIKAFIIAL